MVLAVVVRREGMGCRLQWRALAEWNTWIKKSELRSGGDAEGSESGSVIR